MNRFEMIENRSNLPPSYLVDVRYRDFFTIFAVKHQPADLSHWGFLRKLVKDRAMYRWLRVLIGRDRAVAQLNLAAVMFNETVLDLVRNGYTELQACELTCLSFSKFLGLRKDHWYYERLVQLQNELLNPQQ